MEPVKHPPENVRQILLWLVARTVALEFVQSALQGGNLEAARVSADLGLQAGPPLATALEWANGGEWAETFAREVERSRAAGEAARAGKLEVFGFPVVVSAAVPPDTILVAPEETFAAVLAEVRRKAPPHCFPLVPVEVDPRCASCKGAGGWEDLTVCADVRDQYRRTCGVCLGTGAAMPGPGWRLLIPEEATRWGDHYIQTGRRGLWQAVRTARPCVQADGYRYRRRLEQPRTTEAAA